LSKYGWKDGPATLGPHSLAKHTILRDYIEEYVRILTRSGSYPCPDLMLIDGFAGGGEYVVEGQGSKIHDGSPIVLMNAVETARARLNGPGRKKPFDVNASFVFIEKKRDNWAYLKATLERRFDKKFIDEKVQLIHGSFEDEIDAILRRIQSAPKRKPRPIFVLDQYGYSAIPIDTIAKIMTSVKSAEIFLTLAVDHISQHARTAKEALGRLEGALRIDPRLDEFISGRRDMEEAAGLSGEDRSRLMAHIQYLLHEAFAKNAGARCYTPFFITSKGSHRSYWFLHLANNSKANDVVKELHWKVSNHFEHFGREGTGMLMLGYDPSRIKPQLAFDFGDSAKARTESALVEELPAIIQARYSNGVTLKDLYDALSNETPASKTILGNAVNVLCREDEFEKKGADGEEREAATQVKDSDLIRLVKSPTLFSRLRAKK
jgi:three-Cys-motif partner protein